MVEAKIGDASDQRPLDDIGRVETPAQTDFEDAGIGWRSGKSEEGGRGCHLEEARLDPNSGINDFGQQLRQRLIVDQPPRDPDPLVEANEVRASEGVDLITRRLERGAQKGA